MKYEMGMTVVSYTAWDFQRTYSKSSEKQEQKQNFCSLYIGLIFGD